MKKDPGLREGIFILSCLPCPKLVARFFALGMEKLPPTFNTGRVCVCVWGGNLAGNEETISSQSSWVPLCRAPSSMPSLWGEARGSREQVRTSTEGEDWRPCDLSQAFCPTPSPQGWHQLHTSPCVPALSACTWEVRVWRGLGFASTQQAPWPLRRPGAGAQNQRPSSFSLMVAWPKTGLLPLPKRLPPEPFLE